MVDNRIADFKFDKQWKTIVWDAGYAPTQKDGGWRFVRFRDDKTVPCEDGAARQLLKAVLDGVEQEDLIAKTDPIRTNWKAREQGEPPSL